jgi:hypothetical protein
MDRPPLRPAPFPRAIDVLPLANWKATSATAGVVEIAEGEAWPPGPTVAFERHTVTVPAAWPLADVRLELDVGAEGVAVLHSRLGIERHPIGPAAPPLRAPTRAFGLRIEARRPSQAVDDATVAPRLGTTRLVLLEADGTGDAPQPAPSTDGA